MNLLVHFLNYARLWYFEVFKSHLPLLLQLRNALSRVIPYGTNQPLPVRPIFLLYLMEVQPRRILQLLASYEHPRLSWSSNSFFPPCPIQALDGKMLLFLPNYMPNPSPLLTNMPFWLVRFNKFTLRGHLGSRYPESFANIFAWKLGAFFKPLS